MRTAVSDDYFAEVWPVLNRALEGSGYVLNFLQETSPDLLGSQTLTARFHRDQTTMLEA